MLLQSRQILIYFVFFLNFSLFSQECTDTNPTQYGDCQSPLGFVWTGNSCTLAYGCSVGEDECLYC